MKKADKDRLRVEKQAEKERERAVRKPRARTRARASATQDPTPLYTTEARFGPAGPSPPLTSEASTPPVDQSLAQQLPAVMPRSTPPTDYPTPPGDHPSLLPSASPFPYPPFPATATIPSLFVPLDSELLLPHSASDWPYLNDHEVNAIWHGLPDMPDFAGQQVGLFHIFSPQNHFINDVHSNGPCSLGLVEYLFPSPAHKTVLVPCKLGNRGRDSRVLVSAPTGSRLRRWYIAMCPGSPGGWNTHSVRQCPR
ncbi:hypothetical protein JB92DRAFT_3255858 [Gautieria morchelliformis]|nr:hypothetical protein JB92DRAFT_3255858 [Gautieria morchelliformis]